MPVHLKLNKNNEVLGTVVFSGLSPDSDHVYALLDTQELTRYKLKTMASNAPLSLSDVVLGTPIIIPSASQVPKQAKVVAQAKPVAPKAANQSKAKNLAAIQALMKNRRK